MSTAVLERYHDRLRNFPQPGQGRHQETLGVSNLGILAGLTPEEIHEDIRQATSNTPMPDREIAAAVQKAVADYRPGCTVYQFPARQKPLIPDGQKSLQRIIAQGWTECEADLQERSPLRLPDSPGEDGLCFLESVCESQDLLFIGARYDDGVVGRTLRTRNEWLSYLRGGGEIGPHIIVNPLDGLPALKKSGTGTTLRGDANVAAFHFCLVEFDHLTKADQIRFWSAVKLPIRALIDTGGKSIHAWVEVSGVQSSKEWDQEIRAKLYHQVLIPMGVDSACSNPSRLSRLPGHFRSDSGRYQRLLWLSPMGREVLP